jgi:arsenate reductase
VITVCEANSEERCPVFPGRVTRLHWEFEDPSAFQGTDREKLEKTKVVRNRIKERIEKFITEV